MSWKILQRWFNFPLEDVTEYFTANHGQKFWFAWTDDSAPNFYLQIFYYGRWIGKVEAVPRKDGSLELADINIFPQFRHLRGRGVGSGMMVCLIQEARRRNVRYICGVVSPDEYTTEEQLIKFYKKHGFDIDKNRTGKPSILLKLNG